MLNQFNRSVAHADEVVSRVSSPKELDLPRRRILRYFDEGFLHLRLTTFVVIVGHRNSSVVRKLEKPRSRGCWKIEGNPPGWRLLDITEFVKASKQIGTL